MYNIAHILPINKRIHFLRTLLINRNPNINYILFIERMKDVDIYSDEYIKLLLNNQNIYRYNNNVDLINQLKKHNIDAIILTIIPHESHNKHLLTNFPNKKIFYIHHGVIDLKKNIKIEWSKKFNYLVNTKNCYDFFII